jgi:catechol 2,3-dioxygenase-like lactoylglutathione lyase family enzyme
MRIHHLALRTADLSRLKAFYADVLGLRVVAREEAAPSSGSVWLAAGGAVLMLERAADGEASVTPGTMDLLAFTSDDERACAGSADRDARETWRARLENAGVRVEGESAHTLYFRDPDGRRIAFSTHPLR